MPVIATLDELTSDALVRILTEPKNALVKQYKRLFDMDDVQLKFTPEALTAIAQQALKHKAGARGLRSILETAMLEIMYEIPSEDSVKEVIISEEVILNKEKPLVLYEDEAQQLIFANMNARTRWVTHAVVAALLSVGMNLAWRKTGPRWLAESKVTKT